MKYIYSLGFLLASCVPIQSPDVITQKAQVLTAKNSEHGNSSIGSLITHAIKEVHDLDGVFYPSHYLKESFALSVYPGINNVALIEQLTELREDNPDNLIMGTIKGKDLKKFLLQRAREQYKNEFQAAGIRYSISFIGGEISSANFVDEFGSPLEDQRYYSIALSESMYGLSSFPGYRLKNLNFTFNTTTLGVSLKKTLTQYLESETTFPLFRSDLPAVQQHIIKDSGFQPISKIQGKSHLSQLRGHKVKTRGVVTALGNESWYPYSLHAYIQTPDIEADESILSSEGLALVIDNQAELLPINAIKIGDLIEVTGTVVEDFRVNGMSETQLRHLTSIKTLKENAPLPAPIRLNSKNRVIPTEIISSYSSTNNINDKEGLNPSEGLDYYETLEGMRVEAHNLKIRGFRGGKDEKIDRGAKGYVTLYVSAGDELGKFDPTDETPKGGLITKPLVGDLNPEIFSLSTNHLTDTGGKKVALRNTFFKVGDLLEGPIQGVMTYGENIFGDGSFELVLPQIQEPLITYINRNTHNPRGKKISPNFTELFNRPHSQFNTHDPKHESKIYDPEALSLGSFNLKNLGADDERMDDVALAISFSMNCPDVINLVEIQDANGIGFSGGSGAQLTLERLVKRIECKNRNYKIINIDPLNNNEGGQPGGNIRVAMLYDSLRVTFDPRQTRDSGQRSRVLKNGKLSNNPGRITPENPAFENTRRSLIVEFKFKNPQTKKITPFYMLGNHLNSKLGDRNPWGYQQPFLALSDNRRTQLTTQIANYLNYLNSQKPKSAPVFLLGDFNAFPDESSLKLLEGEGFFNTIYMLPPNERYTTNYNGNSQALDYIFVSSELKKDSCKLESEVLKINSDYMGKISDHDIIMVKFKPGC